MNSVIKKTILGTGTCDMDSPSLLTEEVIYVGNMATMYNNGCWGLARYNVAVMFKHGVSAWLGC